MGKVTLQTIADRVGVSRMAVSNAFGLLMSLNMLVELPGGFDYTRDQFDHWACSAGFDHTGIRHLAGPTSSAIAHKR